MTRILLADDHEFVRHGVRSLLETHPDFEVCGEAVNGIEAVAKAQQLRPDVIVLDISMPEMNGLEAARVIRKTLPGSEILILSQHNTAEVKNAALGAGARGYIAKSDVARDLLAAVTAVSRHQPVLVTTTPPKPKREVRDRPPVIGPETPDEAPSTGKCTSARAFEASADRGSLESASRFRELLDGAPVLLWAADRSGQCTFFNQPYLEFTGRRMEDEKGTGWTQRLHPEDALSCVQTFFQGIQERRPFGLEFRLQRADGEYRWLLNNGVPQFDVDGAIEGYIGSCIDITERKKAEAELRKAHDSLESLVEQRTASLRRLSSRLLQIQDDERRRIARELHDSLGQLLTAAQINLDMCLGSSVPNSDLMQETKGLLERSLAETRTLSHLLHPPLLDETGLESALRWYVDGFAKRSGIQVNLELPSTLQRLSSTVEIATFRVLQESLTNVHRHSRSRSVDIRLSLNEKSVILEVQDHGKGVSRELLDRFHKTGFNVGVGLAGMSERVKELGGQLKISSDDHGTLIHVEIPVDIVSTDHASNESKVAPQTAIAS